MPAVRAPLRAPTRAPLRNSVQPGYGNLPVALALDFLSGVLDQRVTFSRADATSCATYFDSTGRLQTAAANVARFDYDPSTVAGVVGSELFPEGTFDSGLGSLTIFGTAGNVTSTGGTVRINAADGVNSGFTKVTFLTVGKTYRLTFDLLAVTGAGINVNDNVGPIYGTYTTPGTKTLDFVASTSSLQFKRAGGVVDATLDNISVKEVSFAPRGLLIEESRTNLLLNSNGAWSDNTGAGAITFVQTQVGLSGAANEAWLITDTAAVSAHYTLASNSTLTAAVHTVSAFVKAGTMTKVQLFTSSAISDAYATFDLAGSGSIINSGGTSLVAGSAGFAKLSGGWYRIWYSCTMTAGSGGVGVCGNPNSSNARIPTYTGTSQTWIVQGGQIELGAFPTSYIATTGSAVTRAADTARIDGTNFSSWYNQTQGTIVASGAFMSPTAPTVQILAQVDDATSNNRMFVRRSAASLLDPNVVTATVFQNPSVATPAITAGAVTKMGMAYQAASTTAGANGSVGAGSAITIPTVTELMIGSALGTSHLNGYVRSIRYYNTRLTNNQLQTLTT